MDTGVLTLSLPKSERVKPRKINVDYCRRKENGLRQFPYGRRGCPGWPGSFPFTVPWQRGRLSAQGLPVWNFCLVDVAFQFLGRVGGASRGVERAKFFELFGSFSSVLRPVQASAFEAWH